MPKKKERYSTLTQIINALLKDQWQLDDNKYQELKHAINEIHASNVNDTVHNYLIKCLEIKREIGKLSTQITEVTTIGKITEFNQEVESINDKINEIDINKIELGIETKETKTQINDLKKTFQSKIQKLKKNLDLRKKEIEKKQEEQSSRSEASSSQSPIKETGAVPKRKRRPPQSVRVQEEKKEQKVTQNKGKAQEEVEDKNIITVGEIIQIREVLGINVSEYLTFKTDLNVEALHKLSAIYALDGLNKLIETICKQKAEELQKVENQFHLDSKNMLDTYLKSIIRQIVNAMSNDIIRVINRKNNTVSKTVSMPDKEYKLFDQILNCYIKMYSTSLMILELLNNNHLTINSVKSQDELKEFLIRKKNNNFFSTIKLKAAESEIKDKVKNIESIFNTMICDLSEYVVDIPISLYSKIPDVENIKKIEGDLANRTLIIFLEAFAACPEHKTVNDSGVNHTFIEIEKDNIGQKLVMSLVEILKKNGYEEEIKKLIEQSSPNTTVKEPSSSQNGACAMDFS